MSGPELGGEDTLGKAVNSSASGFSAGWAPFCTTGSLRRAESRGGGRTIPSQGRASRGPDTEAAVDLSASQAGVSSLVYTLVNVRLTGSDSNHGTTAYQ